MWSNVLSFWFIWSFVVLGISWFVSVLRPLNRKSLQRIMKSWKSRNFCSGRLSGIYSFKQECFLLHVDLFEDLQPHKICLASNRSQQKAVKEQHVNQESFSEAWKPLSVGCLPARCHCFHGHNWSPFVYQLLSYRTARTPRHAPRVSLPPIPFLPHVFFLTSPLYICARLQMDECVC